MLNSGYCRLCAEIKLYSNLSVIKNEDEYSKNLCYQISQCFQIQISADDNLPKTICLDCCTQTNVTYEFFNKVRRAQEFLRNVVCNPLINTYPAIAFIQPVESLITNENSVDNLIKTKVKSDTGAEQDTQHSENNVPDELWENDSSRDSTTVQTSSTSRIRNKNIKKVDKQSQKDEVAEIGIKSEINSNEICDSQLNVANNEVQSIKKSKVTRKRERSKKQIGESKKRIREALQDYTWICNVCSDQLITRQELIKHFQQKHNKPVEYTCVNCSKTLNTYPVFAEHVQRHKNANKFCCEECGKRFNDTRILKRHIKFVHSQIRYTCELCEKVFKTISGYENHKTFHLPKKPEPVKYPCKICRKKLPTENDLSEHEKVHDESNKHFTCDKCGSRFRLIRNLEEHVENVHTEYSNDQYLQCPLCPTKFKHIRQLRRHRRLIHFPKKPYACETCDKKFNLQTEYKRHRMIHTGERPYKCEHCEKSFRIKAHLKVHNRQHTGEKPYCCSECNHHFTDFSNYIKHMSKKHGVTSFKNVKKITDGKSAS